MSEQERGGEQDYRQTVLLPRTPFPMRARLPEREPARLAWWEERQVYRRREERARAEGRPVFVLHDGPPYANGHIHIGHALNKVLKDIIVRLHAMDGYATPFVPGWDTHGLPVEHQVIRQRGLDRHRMGPLEFRRACREFALSQVTLQREEFRRLGVWGDWEHPYLTLDPAYEARQVEVFGEMVKRGYIYKGLKPVHWCMECETALADAEIEYHDHRSPSIYVRMPVAEPGPLAPFTGAGEPVAVLIWTTTPWTLPANVAVALHPQVEYVLVATGGERLLLARERLPAVARALGWGPYQVLAGWRGRELEGVVWRRPLAPGQTSRTVLAEHVTLDTGTGAVHIAPGHGREDFEVGQVYGLPVLSPVDEAGRFTADVPAYRGLRVDQASDRILQDLRAAGLLAGAGEVVHAYPYCWRSKSPVIFRATEQWFASVAGFREAALAAIEGVRWIPGWGIDRIRNMVRERGDWCISRQRLWGVPIPAFYCQGCGAVKVDEATVAAVAQLFAREGSDAWFARPAAEILPPGTRCDRCGGEVFRKETDTMDVWFDSGSSHWAVLATHPELHWPADLYLEGSDQHRGWFQSSLLTAVATTGQAPYRAVLTHGFVLDAAGQAMHKSLGNVVSPDDVVRRYGADVLRLWVASVDYRNDVRIGDAILDQLVEVYRRIRNTARFLLGNLADFDPARDRRPLDQLEEVDRWALSRLARLVERVVRAYRAYSFHEVYHAVNQFCTVDLSSFYLDVLKDRLYCDPADSPRRRSAQTALLEILVSLARLVAPVLVFTAEEIWEFVPPGAREEESVHLTGFPQPPPVGLDADGERRWEAFFAVREEVLRALEQARAAGQIGASLEASVHLYGDPALRAALSPLAGELDQLLIVSAAEVRPLAPAGAGGGDGAVEVNLGGLPGRVRVEVGPAPGRRCQRCWRHDPTVGARPGQPDLCARCEAAVAAWQAAERAG